MYDLLIATDYGVYVFDSVWSLGLSSADLTRHMHSRWGDGNGQPGSERRYRSAEDIISSVNTEECPRTSCTPHEHRALKAVEKDPSATVVANVRLTGATVVGSVNATEFWQRRTRPPSFLLLLSRTVNLGIPHWSTLRPGYQMIYYYYRFCDSYYCTCFIHWCAVFDRNNLERNRLLHGCSDKIT